MLKNYWNIALRSLLRHRQTTLILLFGLTAGLACFIFISLLVLHETSYDTFHQHAGRIFRIQQNRFNKNELTNASVTSNFGVGYDMTMDLPEVENYVMLLKNISMFIKDGEVFKTDKSCFATSDFFNVFSFKLLQGNDSLVLSRPYSVAFSESFARKIFKGEDPIGKTLNYRGRYDVEVTGVFEDMPEKSHMKFDVILAMETYKKVIAPFVLEEPWRWDGYFNYILLHRADHLDAVKAKLPELIERKTGDWLRETDQKLEINLQPLTDIHLGSNFSHELGKNGNRQTVLFLLAIAVVILVIAWVNYISLATVRSMERAREVGVRKVLGGQRSQLVGQFLAEAFLINLLATLVACGVVYLALPELSSLAQRDLSVEIGFHPWLVGGLLLLLAGSTLCSGLYPAFIISSIAPAQILKGNYATQKRGRLVRKIMVFIPFASALVLLIGIYGVFLQLELLKKTELGFDPHHRLVVENSELFDSLRTRRTETFKKQAANLPGVEQVSLASNVPGEFITFYANSVQRIGAPKEDVNQYRFFFIDENYCETLNIPLIAGSMFGPASVRDKEVLINVRACKLLGFETPEEAINQKLSFRDDTVLVRAVIPDYHHETPKVNVLPTVYVYNPDFGYYFILKMNANASLPKEGIENLLKTIFTGEFIPYFLLTEKYNSQYDNEERFGKVISLFGIVLLIITVSGLFSLSAYMAKFRLKEVGIRKVMGATESEVIRLMLKEYVLIVLLAIGAAIPLAVYALKTWLESFVVRIAISPWLLIVPSAGILTILLLTVLWQTLQAARANPATVLRHE
jgi:putative ABC transport system permease protein